MMAALVAGVADPFDMSDSRSGARGDVAGAVRSRFSSSTGPDDTVLKAAVSSGDVVATSMWSDTFRSLKQKGVPVALHAPQGGHP